jgi:hypothetical protein
MIAVLAGFCASASTADAYVYSVNRGGGSGTQVGRANLDGTGANQSFVNGATGPVGVAVDGSFIYWANTFGSASTIGRASLDGTGVNQSFISGATAPCGVAVDGSYVYWANNGSNSIGRANLDGSGVNQSFITGATSPCGVAVDGAYVYWANEGGTTIGRANLNGTSPNNSFISIGATGPVGVAVNGSFVYWGNNQTDAIGRANLNGSSPNNSFIAGSGGCTDFPAVDATYIYWANDCASSIARANLDGTNVNENFISVGSNPGGVAVDQLAPLSVSLMGTGAGSVSGLGISCPTACANSYTVGQQVTLTAAPTSGSTFAGWSGAGCSGTGSCTVTIGSEQSVTATFNAATVVAQHALSVSTAGSGSGTVTSAPGGIDCGGSCSARFTAGSQVTLAAAPASGSTFAGWTGAGCSGTGTCIVTLNSDQTAVATFITANSPTKPLSGRLQLGHPKMSGNVARVPVTCAGTSSATCSGRLSLVVVETLKGHQVLAVAALSSRADSESHKPTTTKRTLILGSVSVTLHGTQGKMLRLTLNSLGNRLLAQRHKLKVELDLIQGGRTVKDATLTFTLKKK